MTAADFDDLVREQLRAAPQRLARALKTEDEKTEDRLMGTVIWLFEQAHPNYLRNLIRGTVERQLQALRACGARCPRCLGPEAPGYYDVPDGFDPASVPFPSFVDVNSRIFACSECRPSDSPTTSQQETTDEQ